MLAIGVGVPVLAKAGIVPGWFLKFVLFVYFPVGTALWITYYEGWWGGPSSTSE